MNLLNKAITENPTIDFSKANYINYRTKLELSCRVCGKTFFKSLRSFNGERDISNLLEENKIAYMREYSFEECRDIKPLPFDFYLPKENILIEYNGEQHYSFNPFFHKSPENFERQKCHDKIKRDFCFKKGLELIVISYKDSIKEILCKRLKLS